MDIRMEKVDTNIINLNMGNINTTNANTISLNSLKPGEKGRIAQISVGESIKGKLQDMGFWQGSLVECAYRSPFGDPTAYFIKGALIAIRNEEACNIHVVMENEMGI